MKKSLLRCAFSTAGFLPSVPAILSTASACRSVVVARTSICAKKKFPVTRRRQEFVCNTRASFSHNTRALSRTRTLVSSFFGSSRSNFRVQHFTPRSYILQQTICATTERQIVQISDESNLEPITCAVEDNIHYEGRDFVLLKPVDNTFEIYLFDNAEEGEGQLVQAIDVEEDIMEDIFPIAQTVLEKSFGLLARRTALTATVEGSLPPWQKDDLVIIDAEEEYEPQNFQILTTFPHNGHNYSVLVPLDPPLYYGSCEDGAVELLSPSDYRQYADTLEGLFFNGTDGEETTA